MQPYFHDFKYRDYKYIYPVYSRRLGGISVGVNLVNCCNWDCIYCDAPREKLEDTLSHNVNIRLLKKELEDVIQAIVSGKLSIGVNEFKSITIAGNGEPTLSNSLGEVFEVIASVRKEFAVEETVKTLLITNGSRLGEAKLQHDLHKAVSLNPEIWLKVDSVVRSRIKCINRSNVNIPNLKTIISQISGICPLYIQTCFFAYDKLLPTEEEISKYLNFLNSVKKYIRGVYLYTASRKPFDPASLHKVEPADISILKEINERILKLGIDSKFYK